MQHMWQRTSGRQDFKNILRTCSSLTRECRKRMKQLDCVDKIPKHGLWRQKWSLGKELLEVREAMEDRGGRSLESITRFCLRLADGLRRANLSQEERLSSVK